MHINNSCLSHTAHILAEKGYKIFLYINQDGLQRCQSCIQELKFHGDSLSVIESSVSLGIYGPDTILVGVQTAFPWTNFPWEFLSEIGGFLSEIREYLSDGKISPN